MKQSGHRTTCWLILIAEILVVHGLEVALVLMTAHSLELSAQISCIE